MDDLEEDYNLLQSTAKKAADLALSLFKKPLRIYRKHDGSAVTDADLAVDDLIAKALKDTRPSYGWLSEESADHEGRLKAKRVWIIDPIDGTRSFIEGRDDWCIAICLIEDGIPLMASIINAARDEIFEAKIKHGAKLNGQPIQVASKNKLDHETRIAASDGVFKKNIWHTPWPQTASVKASSLAYRLALVADGRLDGAFALKAKSEWDIAAGALIVCEAGGVITFSSGEDMFFNSKTAKVQGFLAANRNLHQILLKQTEGAAQKLASLR